MRKYILNDADEPVLCDDIQKWSEWHGRVENGWFKQHRVGPFLISTAFLGIDHNWCGDGRTPQLFETMVIPQDELDQKIDAEKYSNNFGRYGTKTQALFGHSMIVDAIKKLLRADGVVFTTIENFHRPPDDEAS